MQSKKNYPIDMAVQDARNRTNATFSSITATSIPTLLAEIVQLAKLTSTESRDMEAIRSDYALRTQKQQQIHHELMSMIDKEYASREAQTALIHENVKLLIAAGQYQIAQQIIEKLAELLADSPLKRAVEYRVQSDQ